MMLEQNYKSTHGIDLKNFCLISLRIYEYMIKHMGNVSDISCRQNIFCCSMYTEQIKRMFVMCWKMSWVLDIKTITSFLGQPTGCYWYNKFILKTCI